MKKQLIYLVLVFSGLIACNNKAIKMEDTDNINGVKKIESGSNTEKNKAVSEIIDRDTIKINTSGPFSIKIKVGDILSFSLTSHASTGLESDYIIENKAILTFVGSAFEFDNPSKAEMPGGDRGHSNIFLEAKKAGNCRLKIRYVFRGEVEDVFDYSIIVE